ncbi:hypothetical protein ACJDU8_16930 [Clostridium sp. WILCCON 0269]|uniref:Integral membrane protein n=1 Tax=Candidatus Clostridium eludens TaxID=3381663 RepID=A0ABW8SPZ1_9CLOT
MMFAIQLLIKTCIETAYLIGIIILVGLLLGILRNNSIKNFQRSFGSKALMVTGCIGVPIHELSHAIFALLFRHKISKIKLLQKPDVNGVMGYVQHSYSKGSIYQQIGNFFIGIAPIFGGIFSIVMLMRVIIPQAYEKFIGILIRSLHTAVLNKNTVETILNSYAGLIKIIFSVKNFENIYFYIFLFIAICISSHISLSSADIEGASRGLLSIFLILLGFNALNLSKYFMSFNLIKYNIMITGFLGIAVILSVITYLISLILVSIRR